MSILIKGLEMPKDGALLCLRIYPSGVVRNYFSPPQPPESKIATAIPVSISDRENLISREALAKDLGITLDFDCEKCGWHKEKPYPYCSAELDNACFFLENAEIIVPAERSEDGET